jgi:aspartate-semialdehyde dehydrogenase
LSAPLDKGLAIAVVGAASLIGEMIVQLLEERSFPVAELHPLGTERSIGQSVTFRGRERPLSVVADFDFARADLAFFCAGARISREHAPRAAEAGCLVIDNTPAFRQEPDVPLIVPEVNAHLLPDAPPRRIIASPGSMAIQLAVVLRPLKDAAGLERVNVATYQSVSSAGREAVEELARQSIALLSGTGEPASRVLPKRIAFNCVPQIDQLTEGGASLEELRVIEEVRRLLEDPQLRMNVTAVRVPVFYGHSAAASLETREQISPVQARAVLEKAKGVTVFDQQRSGGYPTVAIEAANRDTVYVGRIREDPAVQRGLNLWIVADNVRKGAATNSIQIAEAWAHVPI